MVLLLLLDGATWMVIHYLDIAEPIGKVIELFEFALTLTITVPSTNGANPGKNLFK